MKFPPLSAGGPAARTVAATAATAATAAENTSHHRPPSMLKIPASGLFCCACC